MDRDNFGERRMGMKSKHRQRSLDTTRQAVKSVLLLVLALLLAGMITGCSDSDSATATSPTPAASLSAPAEVRVAVADDTTATIAWTEVAGAVSYNLYRDVTPGVKKTAPPR
jgi:hypothetical protein